MATRPLPQVPTKLLAIQKDLMQLASMAGFLNSAIDLPQLRLSFTLYGRVLVPEAETGLALTPRLQTWSERLATRLREDSSSAILPPQIQIGAPQPLPNGEGFYVIATITFGSKVTETGYQRVRNAVLAAYQAAVALRERGIWGDEPKEEAAGPSPVAQTVLDPGGQLAEGVVVPLRNEDRIEAEAPRAPGLPSEGPLDGAAEGAQRA